MRGRVLTEEQRQAVLEVLPVTPVADHSKVLLHEDTPWALIKRSVPDVRRVPDGLEQIMQVLIGEAVRVLVDRGYWSLVRVERDGYIGWTRTAAVQGAIVKRCAPITKRPMCWSRSGSRPLSIGLLPERSKGPHCLLGWRCL